MNFERLNLLEVKINSPHTFLQVKETLTRIGVCNNSTQSLYQTAHILHKKGRYYIVHFKEMFLLDNKHSTFDQSDKDRRNTIAKLLQDWGLITIVSPQPIENPAVLSSIKIVSFQQKHKWKLIPKYMIGSNHQ